MADVPAREGASEIAGRVQHALNNALAALMAEAQLLELEELTPPQGAAVRRMVDFCRQMALIVRELDGIRSPSATPPADE